MFDKDHMTKDKDSIGMWIKTSIGIVFNGLANEDTWAGSRLQFV